MKFSEFTLFAIVLLLSTQIRAQEVTTLANVTANGGVTVADNNLIFVSHFGPLPFVSGQEGKNIYRITPTGLVSLFAEDVVRVGTGNTMDSQGFFYQASFQENKVIKLDENGNVVDDNFASTMGPVGVLAIENDTIVICSCSTNTVIKVAQDGNLSVLASGGAFNCPNGITKDNDGSIYVSNFSDGIVTKITRNGTATVVGDTGSSGGHVAYRSEDDMLYLTSYGNHKLFKMDLNGNVEAFAGTGSSGALDATDPLQATFAKPNGLEFSLNGCSLYVSQDEDVMREILFNDGPCDQTGIENINDNDLFKIYPNPSTESFVLENPSNVGIESIQILNIKGQLVTHFAEVDLVEFDISNLKTGVYSILITDFNGVQFSKKLIKN